MKVDLKQLITYSRLKARKHQPQLRYFVLLLLFLIITLTGCGIIPPKPLLYEPPSVSDPNSAAHVTVATEKKFCFSCFNHNVYIELDDLTIAKLKVGQYTKFLVSSSQHTIRVRSNEITQIKGIFLAGAAGGAGFIPYKFIREWFDTELTEDFVAGKEYKFLLSHVHVFSELRSTTIEKVQSFQRNISLDPSKLVLPGTM